MLIDYDTKAHGGLLHSCLLDTERHGLPDILLFILVELYGRDIAVEQCQLGLRVYSQTMDDCITLTERFGAPTFH